MTNTPGVPDHAKPLTKTTTVTSFDPENNGEPRKTITVEELPVTKATKAWVGLAIAAVGSGVTSALGLISASDPAFIPLTIVSAVLTPLGVAFGVFNTTNKQA